MGKQFEIGIVFEDGVPMDDVAPGYEYLEIPISVLGLPVESDALWQETVDRLKSKHLPKIAVCSHFFLRHGLTVTGPGVDRELLEFWTKRALKRCADVGVQVAGIYGNYFKVPEGFSRTKAKDQAIQYFAMMAAEADKHGILVALEPMANLATLFPRYLDGLAIAKETGSKTIRVMADLNYFLELNQPLKDIEKSPEYCLHVHVQGDHGAQANVGDREQILLNLFNILKGIGYERGVSAASPWVSTGGEELNLKVETAKTLRYLQGLRAKVYGGAVKWMC
jgi:sugar phosphate isomerase/epimerase